MTAVDGMTPGAPVRGVVRPVTGRWSRVGRAVPLCGGFCSRCPLPTVSCPRLAVGGEPGRGRVVPKQSP